jgi:apolipoprotein N-acyltransferase
MSRMGEGSGSSRLVLILSAGAGALAGVALPPWGWPPLLLLALVQLWAVAGSAALRPWPRAWAGWLWGASGVAVSHRWLLALHPLDWIGVPGPLSLPLCLALLAAISALAGVLVALWVLLARWLDPMRPSSALLLALLWGLAETLLARGPLFWIGLGAAALPGDRPLAALAALGGSGLLAALQLGLAWLLWRALLGPRRRRWLGIALALALLSHAGGALVLASTPLAPPASTGLAPSSERVLVLQPAIPTRQKFLPEQRLRLRRSLRMAQEQAQQQGASLLLLPEGALGLEPVLDAPAPQELIGGGFRWQTNRLELEQRSSLLRFETGALQPSSHLDKHRLVPLGEWVPLASLVRWSGLSAVGGVEPGAPSRLLPRPAPRSPLAAAICYELANGSALAQASRSGALWLLASANLDPYPVQLQQQFAALAQLRALETGRWLVSAANTGPSLLVSPRGEVVAGLPPERLATGVFTVTPLRRLTPYDRWGDQPLLLLTVVSLVLRVLAGIL